MLVMLRPTNGKVPCSIIYSTEKTVEIFENGLCFEEAFNFNVFPMNKNISKKCYRSDRCC